MLPVHSILDLHRATVDAWHRAEVCNPYEGLLQLVCQQHAFNFQLWHEEDIARSKDVSDAVIAQVKRHIDKFNQQRNDWIEKLDDWITGYLLEARIAPQANAPMNSETPGSIIDRLSILSLRIYHLDEQLLRSDVDASHLESVRRKLAICHEQRKDLSQSLTDLSAQLVAGQKRHKTYRQLKMYNDPTLNPYLYSPAPATEPIRRVA